MTEAQPLVWFTVKIFFLFAIAIYVVFAGVVVRQVHLMTDTVKVTMSGMVTSIAWLHLAVAILAFLFALIIL